jgi:hypothetical protein
MVGISVDHISITRRLPVDPAALGAVLARLRGETSGVTARWTLGGRGTCEVDVTFTSLARDEHAVFASAAMLWDPNRTQFATLDVTLSPCDGDESLLELVPAEPIGAWWHEHLSEYLDLAHAAVEELAQELLWQYSRVQADAQA